MKPSLGSLTVSIIGIPAGTHYVKCQQRIITPGQCFNVNSHTNIVDNATNDKQGKSGAVHKPIINVTVLIAPN